MNPSSHIFLDTSIICQQRRPGQSIGRAGQIGLKFEGTVSIQQSLSRSLLYDITEAEEDDVIYVKPQFKRNEVNKAACVLIEPNTDGDQEKDFEIINNWRASHSFPLNTFQITLRKNAGAVDESCIVAQRLKRLSSISQKLKRFPQMKLSQMQDIAGCRAIVDTVADVKRLMNLYKHGGLKHKLVHEDNYIETPQFSGYRGVHLIYRYFSDKSETYNGLKVEVQLRSRLQHAWATAVETIGTFIQQALKSSQGQKEWLDFFALMGNVIAIKEHTQNVPGTPRNREDLREKLMEYQQKLDVRSYLKMYGAALDLPEITGSKDAHFFLLNLDADKKTIQVTGYRKQDIEEASNDYLNIERSIIGGNTRLNAVLVSVDSLKTLKRAYPNYFLDMDIFLGIFEITLLQTPAQPADGSDEKEQG